jgi:uncharacterized protein
LETKIKQIDYSSCFKILSDNTLFIPHTGKIFQVTDKVIGVLKKLKTQSSGEFFFNSQIMTQDENEIIEYLDSLSEEKAIIKSREGNLYSKFDYLSLVVTQYCNLKCIYCYGNEGTYGEKDVKTMSFDTAIMAVDWFLNQVKVDEIEDTNKKNLDFNFFGGEPLLAFPNIKKIVNYIYEKSKHLNFIPSYSITTNGTLLNDEIVQFFKSYKFVIIVSIDGPIEIHDRNRPYKNGKGTYNDVINGLNILKKYKMSNSVTLRATYIPGKGEFESIIKHLSAFAFRNVFITPVTLVSSESKGYNDYYLEYKEDFAPVFKNIEESIAKKEWPKEYMPGDFEMSLRSLYRRNLRNYCCGAGQTIIQVATNGDIYPCQRFVGIEKWKEGNVKEKILKENIIKSFFELNVDDTERKCKDCWLRYLCGGSCPNSNYIVNGSLKKPDYSTCAYKNLLYEFLIPLYAKYSDFINEHLNEKEKRLKEYIKNIQMIGTK